MTTTTTRELTYAAAKKYLERKGYDILGYSGLGHTGWHRFSVSRRGTIDLRRGANGRIETR